MIKRISFGHEYIRFINPKGQTIVIGPQIKRLQPSQGNDIVEKSKYNFYMYNKIISFLTVKGGVIISFDPSHESSDEEKRRNIFKFDEEGKIIWIVEDKYKKIWKKKIKEWHKEWTKIMSKQESDKAFSVNSKKYKEQHFNNIYYTTTYPGFNLVDAGNKIIADETTGCYFTICIDTGEVEFIKAVKD